MWSKILRVFTQHKSLWLILIAWRTWTMLPIFFAHYWLPSRPLYTASHSFFSRGWPLWVTTWANFDGINYLTIARRGYWPGSVPFFPLYPTAVRIVYDAIEPLRTLPAALLVSYLCFGVSLVAVHKLLKVDRFKLSMTWFYLLWLAYPTSAFYLAAYNDAIFFVFACLCILWSRQGKWFWAGLAGGLATLARLNGVALAVFMAVEYVQFGMPVITTWRWQSWWRQIKRQVTIPKIWSSKIWAGFFIPGAFVGYLAYIHRTFGNWHLLFEAMAPWQQENIIFPLQTVWRYLKIFTTVPVLSVPYWVAVLEFGAVAFYAFMLLVSYKKIRFSYWTYISVSILIPGLTGTFQGMARYAIHLYPLFLAVAIWFIPKPRWMRYLYLLVSLAVTVGVISLFAQGYFVT